MPSNFHPALEWRLPLSGAVVQPWSWTYNTTGSQIGFININLGQSTEPELEQRMLDEVGSYGRQIGQIGDAVAVLIAHLLDRTTLSEAELQVIDKMEAQLDKIAYVKRDYRAELRSARTLPARSKNTSDEKESGRA